MRISDWSSDVCSSDLTGKKVLESAAGTLKRVTLELGGNDASIVLDDVDVAKVDRKIYASAFTNAGQVCIAAKRVYAHSAVYDALCDDLAKLAESEIVGDGLEQGNQMGPVQIGRAASRESVCQDV